MSVDFCGILTKTCCSLRTSKGDLVLFEAVRYRDLRWVKSVLSSDCEYWSNSGENANISFQLEVLVVNVKSLLFGLVKLSLHYPKVANIIGETSNPLMGDSKGLLKCPVLKLAFLLYFWLSKELTILQHHAVM